MIRIAGTRVSLESLGVAHEEGASVEELADSFPDLTLPDIHAAIDYLLRHRDEVERYIEERRRQASEARERIRRDFPEVYREVRLDTGAT